MSLSLAAEVAAFQARPGLVVAVDWLDEAGRATTRKAASFVRLWKRGDHGRVHIRVDITEVVNFAPQFAPAEPGE